MRSSLAHMAVAAKALAPRIFALRRYRAGGPFAPPFKIKFFVTYRCNLRCVHCNLWSLPPCDEEMTAAEYETLFRRNPDFFFVSFSGGEPTLRDDLPDLIRMAARYARGPTVISINLNGFWVDRTVDAIREALSGLDRRSRLIAAVSSDGPEPNHNLMRGDAEAYVRAERTIAGLRALEGDRLEVRRNICVSPINIEAIPDYLSMLGAAGEKHHLCFYQAGGHYAHTPEHFRAAADFLRRLPAVLPAIRRAERAADPLGRIYLDLADAFFREPRRGSVWPCYSSIAAVSVGPTGTVFPCINHERAMGDLRAGEFDLRALLAREKAARVRSLIAAGRCPGCWTPNDAYATILCNLFDPARWWHWLKIRFSSLV